MAIEFNLRKPSSVRTSNKDISTRKIVFVPPRSQPKADSDGFVLPEKYIVQPEQVRKLIGWQHCDKRGLGLRNCGNTCYMNSVLQALTHSSAIANDAISGLHMSNCLRKKSSIFCGYCALLTHVRSSLSSSGRSEIAPDAILKHLKLISKSMRYGRQEDSHEFLRQLIDSCLSGELPIQALVNGRTPMVSPLVRSTTFVGQLFSGYLQSMITCSSCGGVSRTFDPFMDVSLEIQSCSGLVDCLRRFTQTDTLAGPNAYKCSKCQKRVTAKKHMLVHRSPPMLTIQLKRFNCFAKHSSAQKVSRAIEFPVTLDLAPFMSDQTKESLLYSLYAVIVHEGSSMGSGHYVCYAKAANSLWYCFNDCSVRQVSEKHVLTQSAYILMYESKDERVFYPSLGIATTIATSPLITVATPTSPDFPITVINHDSDDEAEFDEESGKESDEEDESIVESVKDVEASNSPRRSGGAMSAFCEGPLRRAVVRARDRKVLRMLTVMKLIARKGRIAQTRRNLGCDERFESPTTVTTTTTHSWGSIPVAAWEDSVPTVQDVKFRCAVARQTKDEPGSRSQHDLEHEAGKNMHNPRSEFTSGNGLPPSLKDSFNAIAKGGKGGMGKGGFGKGKGKGGFGKGKGKGGFGKGKGKGFGKGSFKGGKGRGKSQRQSE